MNKIDLKPNFLLSFDTKLNQIESEKLTKLFVYQTNEN